jgi:hypothetical protein
LTVLPKLVATNNNNNGVNPRRRNTVIEVKAKKTTKKAKAKTEAKKTVCPVCVGGRGMYKDISKHNKKHHGGRTPEVR